MNTMVRSVLRQAYWVFGLLSSPVLLAWLVVGWTGFYVLLSIWSSESFSIFTEGLRHSPLFQAPYVLFLLSGYAGISRMSYRALRKGAPHLLGLLFPLGMLVFFTGFFVSISARQFEWQLVRMGSVVQAKWDPTPYIIESVDDGLKDRFLDIDIKEGADQGFFRYEPRLTLMDSSGRAFAVGAFPPAVVDGKYFHILNFGLAPGIRFREGGIIQREGYFALRILSPGRSDFFEVRPFPYRFIVSLQPEKTYQKGSVTASEFNLKAPTYKIKVFEGEKVLAEEVSKSGISFGSFSLEFYEPTTWVQLEVVEDPGVPLVLAGIIFMMIGVPLAVFAALISMVGVRRRAPSP